MTIRKLDKGQGLRAFSLPEMLVVLVIIGILVLIALPNLMPQLNIDPKKAFVMSSTLYSSAAGVAGNVTRGAMYHAMGDDRKGKLWSFALNGQLLVLLVEQCLR